MRVAQTEMSRSEMVGEMENISLLKKIEITQKHKEYTSLMKQNKLTSMKPTKG